MIDLVTGGAGFLGGTLVERLLRDGAAVRVLDLDGHSALPGGVERIVGSAADRTTLRSAMEGVGRVFHIAGNPRLWAPRTGDFLAANVDTTRAVLDQAAQAGVARIVVTSTAAIHFARRRNTEASLEDMPGGYARSKFLAEQAALEAAASGLPAVILNPCLPMGPGDRNLTPPTRMLLDFVNGATPAFLDFELRIVDVRDLAEAYLAAAERGTPGGRYLLGGPPLRLSELLAAVERISGLGMPRRRVPYAMAFAVAVISELVSRRVTGRPPRAPLAGVRMARRPAEIGALGTAADLGLELRPVERTLADALAWLDEQGLVTRKFSGA